MVLFSINKDTNETFMANERTGEEEKGDNGKGSQNKRKDAGRLGHLLTGFEGMNYEQRRERNSLRNDNRQCLDDEKREET